MLRTRHRPFGLAIGMGVLAFVNLSSFAELGVGEPSATDRTEPTVARHIDLLDNVEALWANRSQLDESDHELWVRAGSVPETVALANCAYTVWDAGKDRDWLEARFDPNRDPKWQLVSVGGLAPTEEQLSKFEGRTLPPISTAHFMEDGEAVPAEALAVLYRTPDYVFFGVKPHTLEGVPRIVRKMQPLITIVVSRDTPSVHIVDVRSTRRHSLKVGMRISSRHHRQIYEYDEAVGAVVMKYQATKMRGRVFLIAKFTIDESQWYDDMSCDVEDAL